MAEPTSFDQSNMVLGKPDNMTDEECSALSVFRGQTENNIPVVISCWKLTQEELDEIIRTGGRVWVTIYGVTMPPIIVSGQNPF